MVVVDEWHELIGNKRGVQVQLALARLRRWNPATGRLGPVGDARQSGRGDAGAARAAASGGAAGAGPVREEPASSTPAPGRAERFPWAGHLGMQMQPPVVDEIDAARTTLVFTNMRSQAEIWYQALLEARPDWAGLIALHHGSLDREVREWVELGLKEGKLKAVVCTSSLDLGVDFLPVERVLQIGSAKGVARLLQRAGRSRPRAGAAVRITLVPTHSLELVEARGRRAARGRPADRGARARPTSRSTCWCSTW